MSAASQAQHKPHAPAPTFGLTPAYATFFDALSDSGRYCVRTVAGHYMDAGDVADPQRVTVVLRVDVDRGLHLAAPLAEALAARGLAASFYFLPHEQPRQGPDDGPREGRPYRLWGSGVPARVEALGMEAGLHSDHLYEQLALGGGGLGALRADVARLADEKGSAVRGMVYHGHPGVDALGHVNRELYIDTPPADLGLEYHDGAPWVTAHPDRALWRPRADAAVSDYLGYPRSWGWNYFPDYPLRALRRMRPGQVLHVTIHAHNAFEYWRGWTDAHGERPFPRDTRLSFLRKAAMIRLRHGLLRGRSPAYLAVVGGLDLAGWLLATLPRPFLSAGQAHDDSALTVREILFSSGETYWRGLLGELGMEAPGGRVLEVGSGEGQWLLAWTGAAAEVVGVEPGREFRERSVVEAGKHPHGDRITVLDAPAEALPFPDGHFERVLCSGVFMFTRQPQAMAEMARVLAPAGRITLTVNGPGYFLWYLVKGMRTGCARHARYGLKGLASTLCKWWFSRDMGFPTAVKRSEMHELMRDAGLRPLWDKLFVFQGRYPLRYFGLPVNHAFHAERIADGKAGEGRHG